MQCKHKRTENNVSNKLGEENYKKALQHAILIIENYEMDIRNSDWTGVSLVEKGFCQGSIYKNAIATIKKIRDGIK